MEVSAIMVGTERRCFFRKGLPTRHEPSAFPHLFHTFQDVVEEVTRRLDMPSDDFDRITWSTLDGPFCGGIVPSEQTMMELRRLSRKHSTRIRFTYPTYMLFVVPNTYSDKIEVFFRPTPEICCMPLVRHTTCAVMHYPCSKQPPDHVYFYHADAGSSSARYGGPRRYRCCLYA